MPDERLGAAFLCAVAYVDAAGKILTDGRMAGRLVRQGSVAEVIATMSSSARVVARTPESDKLGAALVRQGVEVTLEDDDTLFITGMTEQMVGDTALSIGVPLHRLGTEQADLEDVFLELTQGKATIR